MRRKKQITWADKSKFKEIMDIWQASFGDEREYIACYLRHRFTEQNMLVYEMDGELVSMMSLLPVFLCANGNITEGRYVYAVATRPEHRGHGYAAALMEEAGKFPGPLILKPGGRRLYSYYEKMGFQTAFYEEIKTYDLGRGRKTLEAAGVGSGWKQEEMATKIRLEEVLPPDYRRIRDACFTGEGYVMWDEEAIEYARIENAFWKGKALRVLTLHHDKVFSEDILLYRVEDCQLIIKETTVVKEKFVPVLNRLCEDLFQSGTKIAQAAVHFRAAPEAMQPENRAGMIRYGRKTSVGRTQGRIAAVEKGNGTDSCLQAVSWYLNLTLD